MAQTGSCIDGKMLMKWAKRAYPNVQVRVQPVPNIVSTEVYEVHTRPLRGSELRDFDWKLVEVGEPEALLRSLRHQAEGR